MNQNQTIHSCIVCNSDQLKPIAGFEKAWLSRCKNCGMVFSTNNPTQTQLEEYYKGYGRNDYLSPITIKRYNEILDQFESVRKTNRLLDVGCGIGYFLEVAKKRGWEVYGTEFTDEAIRICQSKGINMNKGVLAPSNYEPESFDVITSFEVIEHINTPQSEISNISSLIRKGGLFYVTTPNFNSLLRYYLGEKYNVISWPEHLSYYTPSTLNRLMRNNSLNKLYIQTTGISITRFITSRKPASAPIPSNTKNEGTEFVSENTQDEKLRNRFETNPVLGLAKKAINGTLTWTGKGDALKGLFRKV
jgi:2-polyprenyl-3-methyl-5-hydroxy-6-metoxy-1,4-benzoquinol methylase